MEPHQVPSLPGSEIKQPTDCEFYFLVASRVELAKATGRRWTTTASNVINGSTTTARSSTALCGVRPIARCPTAFRPNIRVFPGSNPVTNDGSMPSHKKSIFTSAPVSCLAGRRGRRWKNRFRCIRRSRKITPEALKRPLSRCKARTAYVAYQVNQVCRRSTSRVGLHARYVRSSSSVEDWYRRNDVGYPAEVLPVPFGTSFRPAHIAQVQNGLAAQMVLILMTSSSRTWSHREADCPWPVAVDEDVRTTS